MYINKNKIPNEQLFSYIQSRKEQKQPDQYCYE